MTVLDKDLDHWSSTSAIVLWHSQLDWEEEGVELDAVLLKSDPVNNVDSWSHFHEERPDDIEELVCHVIGFPGTDDKTPEQRETLHVKAALFADSTTQIQLTLLGGEPERVKYWAGISGSPVLVKDSQRLAAVLMIGSNQHQGRKLWAVPIASLMESQGFQGHLEKPDIESHVKPYLDTLEKHLECHSAGVVLSERRVDWELAWRQGRAAKLARAIGLETPVNDQARALGTVLIRSIDQQRWALAGEIYEILRHAVPVAFLKELGQLPPNRWQEGFEVSVATEAMIEVALASFEKRPMWLREPLADQYFEAPKGRLNVTDLLPLETSIDPDGSLAAMDLAKILAFKLGFPEGERHESTQHRVLEYIVRLSVTPILPGHSTLFPRDFVEVIDEMAGEDQDEWREEFFRVVNGRLARNSKRAGKAYFIANPTRLRSKEFLQELRRVLPELGFVHRSSTSPPHLEDEIVQQIQDAHLKFHQSKKKDDA